MCFVSINLSLTCKELYISHSVLIIIDTMCVLDSWIMLLNYRRTIVVTVTVPTVTPSSAATIVTNYRLPTIPKVSRYVCVTTVQH